MSQISPPIRILLAASLVLMTAWFVFLRPGPVEVAPPAPAPAPAGSGFKTAVDAAKDATATANSASAAAAAADGTGGSAAAPATTPSTGGKPAAAGKSSSAPKGDAELGLPASVAKAVKDNKVLVMLFWNKRAIDDQAVRREIRGIDRQGGKVKVHVAPIEDVARYASITRGVNLEQSPTVVVVKGDTADALVGYVDAGSINQSVSDVMRSTRGGEASGGPSDPYLAQVNDMCAAADAEMDQIKANVQVTPAGLTKLLDDTLALSAKYDGQYAKLQAPKKHAAFKKEFDAANAASTALMRTYVASVKAKPDSFETLTKQFMADAQGILRPLKAKYADLGLDKCFDDA
jgi:hypothetical protein